MHVSVNGVRLFFDVEDPKFIPDGPVMQEKPVLDAPEQTLAAIRTFIRRPK